MSARKFAEAMDVNYTTVMRWLKDGLVPGAELKESGEIPGIKFWVIPAEAVSNKYEWLPKAGRKKQSKK